jgi:ribose transport system permease protein
VTISEHSSASARAFQRSGSVALIELLLDHLVWLILAIVVVVFSATVPNYFQLGIFANIIEQSTFIGTLSIGLALIIIAGHLDLSVESTLALAAMVPAILFASNGYGQGLTLTPEWLIVPASLAVSLLIGAAIGASNALLVVKLGMNAFIATLAAYLWVRGVVHLVSGGRSAQGLPDSLRAIALTQFLQIPLYAWMAILCFLVFAFVLRRTPYGRHITMIGGNPSATYRAGIHVDRLLIITFILAGAIAGLAGWFIAIRTDGASANLGAGMLFQAFAAVVIGGVSLKGGVGRLSGVYAGVLLLAAINTAINLMNVPVQYTLVIHGLLVLAAVLLDTLKGAIRARLT